MNFIQPGTTMIVVKQLTEEIMEKALEVYVEDNAF
jgi:hypothetical protein